MCSSLRCVPRFLPPASRQPPPLGTSPARWLDAALLSPRARSADSFSLGTPNAKVTTRNEVDEDAWDSDGAHTHTSVVTGSTARPPARRSRWLGPGRCLGPGLGCYAHCSKPPG